MIVKKKYSITILFILSPYGIFFNVIQINLFQPVTFRSTPVISCDTDQAAVASGPANRRNICLAPFTHVYVGVSEHYPRPSTLPFSNSLILQFHNQSLFTVQPRSRMDVVVGRGRKTIHFYLRFELASVNQIEKSPQK